MSKILLAACLCFLFIVPIISFAQIEVDIKPGSCPSSYNPKKNGVVPVAIVGLEDDEDTGRLTALLAAILGDPALVELTGPGGGAVNPIDGKSEILSCIAGEGDPTAPEDTEDPNCADLLCFDDLGGEPNEDLEEPFGEGEEDTYCADGIPDLVMYFTSEDFRTVIGDAARNTCPVLNLTTPIGSGADHIRMVKGISLAPSSTSLAVLWSGLKTQ